MFSSAGRASAGKELFWFVKMTFEVGSAGMGRMWNEGC